VHTDSEDFGNPDSNPESLLVETAQKFKGSCAHGLALAKVTLRMLSSLLFVRLEVSRQRSNRSA